MDVRLAVAVVVSLGFIAGLCVGGIVIADALGHTPSGNLGTIAGTCVGALSMLLVNPATRPIPQTSGLVGNTITGPK